MTTPILLEKEASLLHHIARAEQYSSLGAALAAYQLAHGMDGGLLVGPNRRTTLDVHLDNVERKGLVVRKSSDGSGNRVVRLTALGIEYVRRRPG